MFGANCSIVTKIAFCFIKLNEILKTAHVTPIHLSCLTLCNMLASIRLFYYFYLLKMFGMFAHVFLDIVQFQKTNLAQIAPIAIRRTRRHHIQRNCFPVISSVGTLKPKGKVVAHAL